MRLAVRLQREITRLHFYDPGQSDRVIARAIGVSPSTVGAFRNRLRGQSLDWAALQPLDDEAWRHALGTQDHSIAQRKPAPDWAWVHAEMQRPDATLEQLWRIHAVQLRVSSLDAPAARGHAPCSPAR
jgi:hypothetical protein